jgi:hypothetical protein
VTAIQVWSGNPPCNMAKRMYPASFQLHFRFGNSNSGSGLQSLILMLGNADDSASYLMGFQGHMMEAKCGGDMGVLLQTTWWNLTSIEANGSGHMGVQGEVGDWIPGYVGYLACSSLIRFASNMIYFFLTKTFKELIQLWINQLLWIRNNQIWFRVPRRDGFRVVWTSWSASGSLLDRSWGSLYRSGK